jgi:23S rRNA pseudouridine2605 synthase
MPVRLQKFLADAGVASRRASEKVITDGRVTVNGVVINQLGAKIDPDKDHVAVDGRPLKQKRKLYLAIHKPRGYICSRNDPEGRRSLNELFPREWDTLYSVGRLDFLSEGLIFYTNDGDFALKLTHPRYGVRKIYRVSVSGQVTPEMAAEFTKGIFHEGERLKAEQVRILKAAQGKSMVEVVLREGKNREVRRLFESQGLTVDKLTRTQIGPIKLGELPKGKWRSLTPAEIKSLTEGSSPPTRTRAER